MKKIPPFLLVFLPSLCYGWAGSPYHFYDFRSWVLPAYLTCFVFGCIIFLIITFVSWRYKSKINDRISKTGDFLRSHRYFGVIAGGVLIAIPLGIIFSVLWQYMGPIAIIPLTFVIFPYPFVIAIGQFRNSYMLNDKVLKWTVTISVAAILASIVFIILITTHVLPFWDSSIVGKSYSGFILTSHPSDSLKDIWSVPSILMSEIVFSLVLVFFGDVYRKIYSIFKKHKKTNTI